MTLALAAAAPRDLGKERGLSAKTLQLFGVRNGGIGWEYRTALVDGGSCTRVKAYQIDEQGRKYFWKPSKPDAAVYFYPPGYDVKQAVDEAWGTLYLVGGDVAAMTMFEVGLTNTISFFGDKVPDNLIDLLNAWGVLHVRVVGDRDKGGEAWCVKLRDMLKDQLNIGYRFSALPFPVEPKGGKDVNDFWLESSLEAEAFVDALNNLPDWQLPEPVPVETREITDDELGSDKLPAQFIRDIESALGVDGQPVNAKGYTKNFRCPFHDDKIASASWNRQTKYLNCQAASCGNHNAKEVGEHFNIYLRDYLDTTPSVKTQTVAGLNVAQAHEMKPNTPTVKMESVAPVATPLRLAPPLPEYARLTPEQLAIAANGRTWLDAYVEWAGEGSPLTPEIFHEAIGIALLAMVSSRRLKLVLGGENIYSNLYMMIVGKSTIYRKSTAFKLAQRLIDAARLSFLTISGDATPEALFDEMAGMKPMNYKDLPDTVQMRWKQGRAFAAQRMIMKDEASSIFASMKKDYNAGLTEILLQGYDGDTGVWEKILKSRGLISVRDMCLSFLGATTPSMWAKHVGQEENENGFAARFAIITPETIAPYKAPTDIPAAPDKLAHALRYAFMNVLAWDEKLRDDNGHPNAGLLTDTGEAYSQPVITATADREALQQIENYRKALGYELIVNDAVGEDKAPPYGRLATMMAKIALLFAMIDSKTSAVRIEARHAYAAQQLAERWRESLHRLDEAVARSRYDGKDNRVATYLKGAGVRGASIREIIRDCALRDKKHATDVITMLAEDGLIEKVQIDTGRRGPKPIHYRLIDDSYRE